MAEWLKCRTGVKSHPRRRRVIGAVS